MSLEIIKIHEQGKQDSEYIELRAVEKCDLKYYIVSDTTYTSETSISNKLRNIHWFSAKTVEKGDYIFLRTCKGANTSHKNQAGTTTHVIFWGLDKPVWNNTGDAGILFTLKTWNTKKA
ncbi:hypothetical protein [Geothrix edaphica]|uniref:Uncharacterized protein n=1 Tax=Geothrix edaphica TaxID=2927976 RepID=A0ABQ5PZE0_9BACT|nr:hypothetical protein [Geothrix edaphica]GLH67742.1 hypothetical protein GETHED_21060 [Geothrix edaphica]